MTETDEKDPLTLLECKWFDHASQQPFRLVVSTETVWIMELHSHLADVEIIGLLAGRWDKERKEMVVLGAYPCNRVLSDNTDATVNVEMCPESEVLVRTDIEARGLSVVGW